MNDIPCTSKVVPAKVVTVIIPYMLRTVRNAMKPVIVRSGLLKIKGTKYK